jgi:hypothetical protein
VAEPAAPRVGAAEVAVHHLEGELLEDLVGGVRVAQHLAQGAADRSPVAGEQLVPGSVRFPGLGVIGPVDKRPRGRDPAEPPVRVILLHAHDFQSHLAVLREVANRGLFGNPP